VKADMVYTFSLDRLSRFKLRGRDADGKRMYRTGRLSIEDLAMVKECVKKGLSLV